MVSPVIQFLRKVFTSRLSDCRSPFTLMTLNPAKVITGIGRFAADSHQLHQSIPSSVSHCLLLPRMSIAVGHLIRLPCCQEIPASFPIHFGNGKLYPAYMISRRLIRRASLITHDFRLIFRIPIMIFISMEHQQHSQLTFVSNVPFVSPQDNRSPSFNSLSACCVLV